MLASKYCQFSVIFRQTSLFLFLTKTWPVQSVRILFSIFKLLQLLNDYYLNEYIVYCTLTFYF